MNPRKVLKGVLFAVSMSAFILLPFVQAHASLPDTVSASMDQKNLNKVPDLLLGDNDKGHDADMDREKVESPDDKNKGTGNDDKKKKSKKGKKGGKKKAKKKGNKK